MDLEVWCYSCLMKGFVAHLILLVHHSSRQLREECTTRPTSAKVSKRFRESSVELLKQVEKEHLAESLQLSFTRTDCQRNLWKWPQSIGLTYLCEVSFFLVGLIEENGLR